MDYDIVRNSVQHAYRYLGNNDTKFNSAMNAFYEEGAKNPSVARIILQEQILKRQIVANEMLKDVVAIQNAFPSYSYELSAPRYGSMYFLAATNAAKSLSAADLYNNSRVLNGNSESESRSKFDKKWNQLYPRTGELRKRIIKANRISMDKTTPKAKWSSKLYYARSAEDYIKDYPKTFRARYFLITKGQIIDGQVTKKVKGFFNRFFYKRFIKVGFSFKK